MYFILHALRFLDRWRRRDALRRMLENLQPIGLIPARIAAGSLLFPSIHSERSLAPLTPARPFSEVPSTPCRSQLGVAKMNVSGRRAYRVNLSGFALVTAPPDYRVMGVKTLIVSYQGVVYQKDLGPDTLKIFKTWTRPHDSWPRKPRTFRVGQGKTELPGTHSAISAGDTFANRTRRC